MRLLLILATALPLLGACNLVYKLPTRQGNVIEQKQLDQLKVGMTREQVVYLMGTPLAASPFREDRWDYVGYYKSPRGKESKRVVTLFFDDAGLLSRMEGVEEASAKKGIESPDIKTVIREEQRDASDAERRSTEDQQTGVVITPDK